MSLDKFYFVLQLADNALVMGHRLSEWCAHGPILEQDIAITNTALDHLGQARSLYQYAADLYNQLDETQKATAFTSLQPIATATEDTFPYLRDAWDFKNILLVEQPNGDWAQTIIRSYCYDQFMVFFYKELSNSADETLKAIAQKSLKEVEYHLKWSAEWVIRLGDGTDESHQRMLNGLDNLWAYTGEMFQASNAEQALISENVSVDVAAIQPQWLAAVTAILEEATLPVPNSDIWMQTGGKTGTHTENMGYILTELQFVQRAYPGLEW